MIRGSAIVCDRCHDAWDTLESHMVADGVIRHYAAVRGWSYLVCNVLTLYDYCPSCTNLLLSQTRTFRGEAYNG